MSNGLSRLVPGLDEAIDALTTELDARVPDGSGELAPTTKYLRSDGAWAVPSGGGVDTTNSPNAGEFAKFTDADTLEGRTAAETRSDLGLGSLATQSGTFSGTSSGTNTGDDATNAQYSGLAASKQNALVSGTNVKTINGSSVLGSGDLVVSGAAAPQNPTIGVQAADYSLLASYSMIVADVYEISDTFTLDVLLGAVFEVI